MTPVLIDFSYQQFLYELQTLLNGAGITHSRLPVRAGVERKENCLFPVIEEYSLQVGRVILYMEEHLTEELSLDDLAEKVELSKYQLIRRFQEEEGTTPWKYVIQKRLEKARQLLESGIPPGQVAAEAGFYDQSHFCKSFRDEIGQTPKEYQEQNFKNRN